MDIFGCIDKCIGCDHMVGYRGIKSVYGATLGYTCEIYMRPYAKWGKLGGCEAATNRIKPASTEKPKARVGQQKQKKSK